jgi:hypothetical protein
LTAGIDRDRPLENFGEGCTVGVVMRRVFAWLFAAGLVVGCSGHESVSPDPTTSTKPKGVAVGIMRITGGPRRPGHGPLDQRLPGLVVALHPGESHVVATVNVGSTGRFRIALPPGRYELLGRPENRGIMPVTSAPFQIEGGRTVAVDLTEHAT